MINIRKGLFETNSSSTHAICIGKNNHNLEIPSELTFQVGEFGWENKVYYDTTTLASYLYTALTAWYDGKELTKYINHIVSPLECFQHIPYPFLLMYIRDIPHRNIVQINPLHI